MSTHVRTADLKSRSIARSEWRPIGEVFLAVMSSVETKRGETGLPRPARSTPN